MANVFFLPLYVSIFMWIKCIKTQYQIVLNRESMFNLNMWNCQITVGCEPSMCCFISKWEAHGPQYSYEQQSIVIVNIHEQESNIKNQYLMCIFTILLLNPLRKGRWTALSQVWRWIWSHGSRKRCGSSI